MPITPALTSGEIAALDGPSTVLRYLSPVLNSVKATALINQAAFVYPLIALTVDTTSADWLNGEVGDTVYIGTTPGGHEIGIYRMKTAPNSTTLFIGEESAGDPGLIPQSIRTGAFANNQYVTVLDRADLWSVLPRIDPVTAKIYEDFNLSVGTNNTTPPPLTYIYINGRANHLADYIETDTLAITAVASVIRWPTSGSSTVSYAWTVPGSWTGVSGATSATLTANAPPGNYILRVTITDSVGGAAKRKIYVNVHDAIVNPPLLISNMPRSDTRDRVGRRMSFDLYDNRLASIPDGAMVMYFEVGTWNGTDVPTATKQFNGWVQRVERQGSEGLRDAAIDLIGPANILTLLNSTSQVIQVNTSPTTWQQAVASLMSASFMAWYILKWRTGNLLLLFNFTTFSTDPTGQRLPVWQIDKGSILQQIQQLATDSGNFGANSAGEFFFLKLPQMIKYANRSGIVVRDSLNASIYNSVTITEEKMNRVSQVRGEAFSWNGSATQPTPYYSDAPQSPGQGGSQIKLLSQVVADQDGDNVLAENWYAYKNNPYPSVVTKVQGNRDVIEPAELPFLEIQIPDYLDPGAETMDGTLTWQRNCVPLSVNKKHNPDGTADIEITSEAETAGFGAVAIAVPVGNTSVYTPPYTPPASQPPDPPNSGGFSIPIPVSVPPTIPASGGPTVVPGLGAIKNSSTKVYRTFNIVTATGDSDWDDVTPPDAFSRIVMCVMDQGTNFSRAAYCLSTDETDSVVSYTKDIFVTTPTWTTTGLFPSVAYEIRSTRGIPGEVYCAGSVITPGNCTDGWRVALGTEISRTGTTITASSSFAAGSDRVQFGQTLDGGNPPAHFVDRSLDVHIDSGPGGWAISGWWGPDDAYPSGEKTGAYLRQCTWLTDFLFTAPVTITATFSGGTDIACGDCGGSTGATFSVQSTDYGASFLSSQHFGTTTDTVGFDVSPKGLVTLAGDVAEVVEAFGGVYAQETRAGAITASYPIAIKVPDLRVGSASLTNISGAPSYFLLTKALVSGIGFWKVTSSKSSMSPSVGGFKPVGVSVNGLDSWRGKTIMAIGEVTDATPTTIRYLFISRNTGSSWSHITKATAAAVHARRLSLLGNQWILSLGSGGVEYSNNWGATWVSKGSTETIYSEIFG